MQTDIENSTISLLLNTPDDNEIVYHSKIIIYHGPFQQVQNVILKIKNFEIDLLSILRGTSVFYITFCIFWFISILGLLLSLKFEILDLVFINTFCLIAITIFAIIKLILTGLVIFYQVIQKYK